MRRLGTMDTSIGAMPGVCRSRRARVGGKPRTKKGAVTGASAAPFFSITSVD